MIYLASPYTHESPKVMEFRYDRVMEITVHLMKYGHAVFSPIVHCHVLAKRYDLPKGFTFWQKYNKAMINCCTTFMVAAISSWSESVGVRKEYAFALKKHKPIHMIEQTSGEYKVSAINMTWDALRRQYAILY